MKIIVPMAGLGSRFKKVADTNPEYKKPKPFILVKGIPMVRWATGSLPFLEHPGQSVSSSIKVTPSDLIFIILKEHDDEYALEKGLREIYSDAIRVIVLPKLTRGAAETAYQAKPFVSPEEDVIVRDSDNYFDGAPLAQAIEKNRGTDVAGIIPVFVPPADNIPKWSYSLTEPGGTRIIKEGEKDPELMRAGAYANIGAYYFSQSRFLFETFEKIERENKMSGDEGKKEFYISTLYEELLNAGEHLEVAILSKVLDLGTPEALEAFLSEK